MSDIAENSKLLKRKYFLCIGLIIAVLGFAGMTVKFLPAPIADHLVRENVMSQATIWYRRIVSMMAQGEDTFRRGTIAEADIVHLEDFTASSDIFRFKLFTADGTVFWSSRAADRGTVNTKPYFESIVSSGERFYQLDIIPASEVDDFSLHNSTLVTDQNAARRVAEIYVPVLLNGQFIGAVEFYRDVTEIRASYLKNVTFALVVFSTVCVALFLTTVGLILMAGERSMRQIRAWAASEQELQESQRALMREVKLLSELNEWLQTSRSLDELFDMVTTFMTRLMPGSAGSVYVYSNSRDVLDGACAWNGETYHTHIKPEACWSLRRGRAYAFGESEINFACEHVEPHDGHPYFCLPILAHGETVGLMHLRPSEGTGTEEFLATRKLAQMAAEQISLAIANARMRDQLHDQSVRDPLTGLFNRRHFTESLRKQVDAAARKKAVFSLVSVDVDHFKKFNDNHGHDAGDMVLRAVGSALEGACDGNELACRLGGEEFMILLPEMATEQAVERAETIRTAVEGIAVRYGEKTLPRITISLGVASYPDQGAIPQDLMKSADDALYDAKAKGRNQTSVAARAEIRPDGSEKAEANPDRANLPASPITTLATRPAA